MKKILKSKIVYVHKRRNNLFFLQQILLKKMEVFRRIRINFMAMQILHQYFHELYFWEIHTRN